MVFIQISISISPFIMTILGLNLIGGVCWDGFGMNWGSRHASFTNRRSSDIPWWWRVTVSTTSGFSWAFSWWWIWALSWWWIWIALTAIFMSFQIAIWWWGITISNSSISSWSVWWWRATVSISPQTIIIIALIIIKGSETMIIGIWRAIRWTWILIISSDNSQAPFLILSTWNSSNIVWIMWRYSMGPPNRIMISIIKNLMRILRWLAISWW